MCYRAKREKPISKLESQFNAKLWDENMRDAFDIPDYNINGFAHPNIPIIGQGAADALVLGKWGLVPAKTNSEDLTAYYKDYNPKYRGALLNHHSEKVFSYWLYKQSIYIRRCIIPLDGFYEPHHIEGERPIPYHFKRKDDQLLAVAGIFTVLNNDAITFGMLTKAASPLFAHIHNSKKRQVVLLPPGYEKEWLREDLDEPGITKFFEYNYPDNELEVYPVSRDLNKNVNDTSVTIKEEYVGLTLP